METGNGDVDNREVGDGDVDNREVGDRDCETDPSQCFTDHCLSSPCYPGVVCQSLGSSYQCGPCPPGFSPGDGQHCTKLSHPCASSPCYPEVQCVNVRMGDSTGYVCGLCPPNMTGDGITCLHLEEQKTPEKLKEVEEKDEVDEVKEVKEVECPGGSCYPGVRCRAVWGGVKCGACPPGLSGDGVECEDIDDCHPNPCYPGVRCEDNKAPRRGYQCGQCPGDTQGDGMTCRLPPSSLPLLATRCTRHCR